MIVPVAANCPPANSTIAVPVPSTVGCPAIAGTIGNSTGLMRLLVVVVLAIAGFVTVIGSSRDVGTFGLLGTPITAANVSSRFVTVGVGVVVADAIDGVGGFGVVGSLMEAPDAPSSFPVPNAAVPDDEHASLCCLLIRSKVAELFPLGSRPFFDGTSTVDMIGGFVSIAFVSIVVLG